MYQCLPGQSAVGRGHSSPLQVNAIPRGKIPSTFMLGSLRKNIPFSLKLLLESARRPFFFFLVFSQQRRPHQDAQARHHRWHKLLPVQEAEERASCRETCVGWFRDGVCSYRPLPRRKEYGNALYKMTPQSSPFLTRKHRGS